MLDNSPGELLYALTLLVGALSYIISTVNINEKKKNIDDYLFEGNTFVATVMSLIGSGFSITFLLTMAPALYWSNGLKTFFPFLIGALSGCLLLLYKARNKSLHQDPNNIYGTPEVFISVYSPRENMPIFFWFFAFIYLLIALFTEICVFRNGLLLLDADEQWCSISTYFITLIAAAYVYIRGFRGVLTTDKLQAGLMLIATFVVIWYTRGSVNYENFELNRGYSIKEDASTINELLVWAGIIITGICWLGSAPEVWFRLITIPRKAVKKTILWTGGLLTFVIILPAMLLLFLSSEIQATKSYIPLPDIWKAYINNVDPYISIPFIIIVITALFTTIDTFLITFSQLLRVVKNRLKSSKYLSSNHIRLYSFYFCIISMIIASNPSLGKSFVWGILGYCLLVPLFLMIYVQPLILRWIRIKSVPHSAYVVPVIFYPFNFIYIMDGVENGVHTYHLMPVFVFIQHLIAIILASLYMKWKTCRESI